MKIRSYSKLFIDANDFGRITLNDMYVTSRNIQHYLNTGSVKYIDEAEMYLVTTDGNIYSLHNRNKGEPRKLKLTMSNGGYWRVRIYINGEVKRLLVHRAVADAFIPNPKNYPTVNHKDENPYNNSVDNLEWCTQKYNNNYGTRNERMAMTLKRTLAKKKLRRERMSAIAVQLKLAL